MERQVAHSVTYETDGTVPISSIAESLLANERLLMSIGEILGDCVDGLTVEKLNVGCPSSYKLEQVAA